MHRHFVRSDFQIRESKTAFGIRDRLALHVGFNLAGGDNGARDESALGIGDAAAHARVIDRFLRPGDAGRGNRQAGQDDQPADEV